MLFAETNDFIFDFLKFCSCRRSWFNTS